MTRRSNNNVNDWKEFDRLKELPNLVDLLLINTPLYFAHVDEKTGDEVTTRALPDPTTT